MEVEVSTKSLADYLNSLPNKEAKEQFAKNALNSRLPTSGGKQISFCSATLAIALDRESHGKVSCDELCPNADFEYLRRSSKPKRTA